MVLRHTEGVTIPQRAVGSKIVRIARVLQHGFNVRIIPKWACLSSDCYIDKLHSAEICEVRTAGSFGDGLCCGPPETTRRPHGGYGLPCVVVVEKVVVGPAIISRRDIEVLPWCGCEPGVVKGADIRLDPAMMLSNPIKATNLGAILPQ